MSRSLPVAVNKNKGLVGDNGDAGVVDCVSDRESFPTEKPIVDDRNKSQPDGTGVRLMVRLDDGSGKMERRSADYDTTANVDGVCRLKESDRLHRMIKDSFLLLMGEFGVNAQVEHIDLVNYKLSSITIARFKMFFVFSDAVKRKSGHPNTSYAWFGASKDQINNIILHGFSHEHIEKDGAFGHGLYLNTDKSILDSVKSSIVDDEGIRHILICRVTMGRPEVITPGSKQCHPSSDVFVTGVDSMVSPSKYIVWSPQINTHIIIDFVIRFKTLPFSKGPGIEKVQFDMPFSPSMPIEALISELSKILPTEVANKLHEYHKKYIDYKISRRDMLLGFRELAGDKLLVTIVKDFKEQQEVKEKRGCGVKRPIELLSV